MPPENRCLLLGEAPGAVEIDGQHYAINNGFRYSLLFEGLMLEDGIPALVKARQALRLYYPVCPENQSAAMEAALWFWRRGEAPAPGPEGPPGTQLSDWQQDAGYLYAAFMADYGIDLSTCELHWWKFCALLEGLRPENLFCKILDYRTADLGKLEGDTRSHYARMKRRYALNRMPDGQRGAIAEILAGDGDLERLLKG